MKGVTCTLSGFQPSARVSLRGFSLCKVKVSGSGECKPEPARAHALVCIFRWREGDKKGRRALKRELAVRPRVARRERVRRFSSFISAMRAPDIVLVCRKYRNKAATPQIIFVVPIKNARPCRLYYTRRI